MEWSVVLKTKGLEQRIADTEQEFTKVRDLLDVLEAEEDGLKKVWKSSAMRQWEKEFCLLLAMIRKRLKEMQNLTQVLCGTAENLSQIEKDMMCDAEEL